MPFLPSDPFFSAYLGIFFGIMMAMWNSEKDLLAVVTEDSEVLLQPFFNWQWLRMVSPGKSITFLCW
ncbi:hypothetical protein DsansV1_C10g0102141 [Dioscorea sansibarensis]